MSVLVDTVCAALLIVTAAVAALAIWPAVRARPAAAKVAADGGAGQAGRADAGVPGDAGTVQGELAADEAGAVQEWLGTMFELASRQAHARQMGTPGQ
jgi:hypothetical protein